MKTKIFTLFLALAASVGTMTAEIIERVQIGDLYYNLDTVSQTAEVTYQESRSENNYSGLTSANIPASVFYTGKTYSVTSIGVEAFCKCSSLTSVTIGNSVMSIGESSFHRCNSLTSVTIPDGVTSIGDNAFFDCYNLTSITIPNSVTSIGTNAFYNCGLTSPIYNAHMFIYLIASYSGAYSIPNGIESIAASAFSGCDGLTSITIPSSVTSIGDEAFHWCSALTSITIPNSVTSIGKGAFEYCSGLTSITIPNNVTSIGNSTFWGCTGLTSITIPNSVTSIGKYAFYGCSGLTSVTIPNGVTSIENETFRKCTGLTSITIPNSVTSIGDQAFMDCSGLTSITIPNNVTSIGIYAFYECKVLTSVTIGNNVTSIGNSAFNGCSGLTSMACFAAIPPTSTVTSGFGSPFYGLVKSAISLSVPAESIDLYKSADLWKSFNILPISAKDVEIDTLKAEPTNNSVEVTWPIVTGAATYELVIKDKSGNVICTLVFNANGQLQSIAFNTPGRNAAQQTQSAGFAFTVTGLEEGTSYDLTLTAKDGDDNTLDTKSVSFTTEEPQGIDQITNDKWEMTNKILRDGQVFILRGEKTYTLTGAEVK